MIRYLVTLVRNFVGLILLAAIAAGGAWAQNGNPSLEPTPDVLQLIQKLKSPDTRERIHAARELDKIKPLPPAAIKPLLEMLRTAPANEAQYAINPLSRAGPRVIPQLAALSNAGNDGAAWTLGLMAFSEPASWPILIGLFKSESTDIRRGVPFQLAKAGPPVVPLLIKALKDDDPHARAGAADTLGQMGHMPGNLVGVRYAKAEDLAPAAPQLVKLLSDPDSEVRDKAALALAYADPSDKRAVPILVEILDRNASDEVMEALRNMGSNAKDAVPAVARVLASNRDSATCVWAARTLGKIGGTEACALLTQAIVGSENDQARQWVTDAANSINEVREGAAEAIVKITPLCPQTIPTLIATLGKPWAASAALTELGGPAIPALAAAAKDPNLSVREIAVETLAAIRPVSPAAVRALTLALRSGSLDLDSRQAAAGALAEVTPLTPEAVEGLMLALKDQSGTIRSAAATALQDSGGEAGQAARAELKREQLIEAQRSQPDTRSYSEEEILATIHDPDLEEPLTLKYLVPLLPAPAPIDDAPFVITVHTAEDQNERLIIWKKTGDGRYAKINVMEGDPDNSQHFDVPITFQAMVQVTQAGGHQGEEPEFFVEIPVEWYRGGENRIFAVDGDGVHAVEIESPDEIVPDPKHIAPKYRTASRAPDLGSLHQLEWSYPVRNEEDPMCCPTGGEVHGTYKIVKDGTASTPTWKMVVATAKFSGSEAAKKLAETSRLIGDLKSRNQKQRRDALEKLSETDPLPAEAIRPLAEVAKTADAIEPVPAPPEMAAHPTFVTKFFYPDASENGQPSCEIAIQTLGRAAKDDAAVWPVLIGALKGCSSPKVAAAELAKAGPPVVPLLLKVLKDKDPRVRAGAAEALGQMVKPPLIPSYPPDRPFGIPNGAASASAAALAPAASGLAEALRDPDSNVRIQAAIALALIAPSDQRSVPILVQVLEGTDRPLREAALGALDSMGTNANGAVPAVERMLAADKDSRTAAQAAQVLGSAAGAAACEPLAQAIAESKDSFVRESAITTMVRLWPVCPQTIPTLTGTFDGVDDTAFAAARALGQIGKPAIPALTAALKSAEPKVRQAAAEAFASMNVALAPEAVAALTVALGDKDSVVRANAAQSLRNAGGAAQQAALAEEKRAQAADEAAHPQPHIAPVPTFSREQIIAPIHPDAKHKYPLKIALFSNISGYAVTLHTGKDRPERLVFWKVDDGKYQKLALMESNPDSGEHFQVPASFDAAIDSTPGESFVDVATLRRGGITDRALHIDEGEDQFQPLEIESPEDWYKGKLAPSETVRHPGRNFFSDGGLEFEFQIWKSNDQDCCPTGGLVTGTYKIVSAQDSTADDSVGGQNGSDSAGVAAQGGVGFAGAVNEARQTHGEGSGAGSSFIVESNSIESNTATTWKMVVDTAKRQP